MVCTYILIFKLISASTVEIAAQVDRTSGLKNILQKPRDSWERGIGIIKNLFYLRSFILYLHPPLPHKPLCFGVENSLIFMKDELGAI